MDTFVKSFIVILVLAMGVLLLMRPPPMSANDMSRWATVERLVFSGTYVINDSHFSDTLDRIYKVDEKGEKIYYSSKPVFLSTMVSGIAWVFDLFELDLVHPQSKETRFTMSLILILINYVPFGMILWGFYRYLARSLFSTETILISFLAAAIGTYFTGYLSTLNNHTSGMISIFASLLALEKYRSTHGEQGSLIVWASFFAGLAVAFESAAALYALTFMAYVVFQSPSKALVLKSLAACCIPLFLWGVCEYLSSGVLLPRQIYIIFGEKHPYSIDKYWNIGHDVDAYRDPILVRAFHMLLGHHGFFSLTPIFLLIPASILVRKAKPEFSRKTMVVFFFSFVGFLVFCLTTRNYGGLCQGFRWLFWLIPFWLLLLPHALEVLDRHSRNWKILAMVLLMISCYSAFTSLLSPWSLSWLDRLLRPELLKFL